MYLKALSLASFVIANWKTLALFVDANWSTIVKIFDTVIKAQKKFATNSDKKEWVMDTLVPAVKEFTPAQLDAMIDRVVDLTKMFGWLPAPKQLA